MTYSPKVYRDQGGDQITVANGGELEIESGGAIQFESGGYANIASGGYLREPVVTVTTSVNVPGTNALAIVSSTASTGVGAYTINSPTAAGVHVRISCLTTTGGVTVTSTSATISAGTTVNGTVLTFLKRGDSVDLIASSASKWWAIRSSTNVTCT